jgi:hypothetical protein
MNGVPAVKPQEFDACPVLLTQRDDVRANFEAALPS